METANKLPGRIAGFDVVRVFACLCVLTAHFNARVSGYDNGTFVYNNSIIPNLYFGGHVYLGTIGVCLFFILSGATLTLSYRGGAKRFYIRRFKAIYPMFWIAYGIVTSWDFLANKDLGTGKLLLLIPSLLGMDGYLCTLGVIGYDFYRIGEWFLGCIVLLYLAFPLLLYGMRKQPILTAGAALAVYVFAVRRVSEVQFFLRIPEMLLGIAITQYHWARSPWKLTAAGAAALLLAWLLRSYITNLTFTIALAVFLFGLLCALSARLPDRAKAVLAKLSALTYPAFLVHHWLIAKLISGFYLPDMGRRNIYMLYAIYLVLTFALCVGLQKLTKRVLACFSGKRQTADMKKEPEGEKT